MYKTQKGNKKHEIQLFLLSYFLTMLTAIIKHFFSDLTLIGITPAFTSPKAVAAITLLHTTARIFLLFVCALIIIMKNQDVKFFHNKGVKVLNYGIFAWLLWIFLVTASGLAVFSLIDSTKDLSRLIIFYLTIFLSAKVIILYDIKREFLGVSAYILGVILFIAYVTHFNGLEFLTSISNLFMRDGRYRVTFGVTFPNEAGRLCSFFFMYTAIYRACIQEQNGFRNYIYLGGGGY